VKIKKFWSMTKKRSSEILADENRDIFLEKTKLAKQNVCPGAASAFYAHGE